MKKPYYNLEQRQLIHLNTSIGAFMQFHLACLNFGRELERTAKRSKFLLFIFSVMARDCVEFPSTLAEELSVISPYTVEETDKIVRYAKIANNTDDDKSIVVRHYCMQAIKIAQEEAICLNEAIVRAVHAP
jgi:hypothetical protein